MTEKSKTIVDLLMVQAAAPHPDLIEEVRDVQWADYGRLVDARLTDMGKLVLVINRAGMKCKTVTEMARYIQAYLRTGALP